MSIKNVLKNAGIYMNTALVAIGWLLFLIGMLIPEPIIKIGMLIPEPIIKTILMAIAEGPCPKPSIKQTLLDQTAEPSQYD